MSCIICKINNIPSTGVAAESVSDFLLLGTNGESVESGQMGLLLYGGGTVCDDYFNTYAADAICRELGFGRMTDWTYGYKYEWRFQSSKPISLDNVKCGSDRTWSNCHYNTYNNCGHSEDVFLTCAEGITVSIFAQVACLFHQLTGEQFSNVCQLAFVHFHFYRRGVRSQLLV